MPQLMPLFWVISIFMVLFFFLIALCYFYLKYILFVILMNSNGHNVLIRSHIWKW